jgi:hypothetical protein
VGVMCARSCRYFSQSSRCQTNLLTDVVMHVRMLDDGIEEKLA